MSDIKYVSVPNAYNKEPDGWREITEGEFAQSMFFTYHPVSHEYRQIIQGNEPVISAKMFNMHDGTGVAMSSDYWDKKVRYYAYGCQHEWGGKLTDEEKNVKLFRCDHVYKCKKCGFFQVVDSSD
jgi:hypothetical protein